MKVKNLRIGIIAALLFFSAVSAFAASGETITRHEAASRLARVLASLDVNQASEQNQRILKKLILEFQHGLEAVGMRIERLDRRLAKLVSADIKPYAPAQESPSKTLPPKHWAYGALARLDALSLRRRNENIMYAVSGLQSMALADDNRRGRNYAPRPKIGAGSLGLMSVSALPPAPRETARYAAY
jgi:hypothetical protein